MQIAYAAVTKDFNGQEDLIGSEYSKLQKWDRSREMAFGKVILLAKHVWTTLTGFWQDVAGKFRPHVLPPLNHYSPFTKWRSVWPWSWLYLAKQVAAILRAVWHMKPSKQRKPSASGTSFSGLGALVMLIPYRSGFRPTGPQWCQQLQQKEDSYCAENPSWMDQEVAPADIRKQWQEAPANRRMQFKVGNYRDGSWESNIRMLTVTIKVDWIQLPVELYLAALPTLKLLGYSGRKVLPPGELAGQEVWCQKHVGDLDPQWRLLQSQLETRGPGWYSTCWAQGATLHK